ncbi:hypothetical protein MMC27_002912 [Xylographa pallens]|nr:hypothetical protein [Xylographa pallens]
MANNLSRANIPSRLNPTAEAFVPSLRSPLSIWSPLERPNTCWLWAEDRNTKVKEIPDRSPPENVLSMTKESTNAKNSGISDLSTGDTHPNEGPAQRNVLAAELDAPDRNMMDERLKRQLKIVSLKDYCVRHYVKSLRAIPMKLEPTLEVIKTACTDIMAFEGVIINSPAGGVNNDFAEAVKNILKAVKKQEDLIDVLTRVRISTESRLYKESLGHLLHNT